MRVCRDKWVPSFQQQTVLASTVSATRCSGARLSCDFCDRGQPLSQKRVPGEQAATSATRLSRAIAKRKWKLTQKLGEYVQGR